MTALEAPQPWMQSRLPVDADEAETPALAGPPVALTEAQFKRLLLEIERRSIGGLFMHLPAWLLLAGMSGLYRSAPALTATVAALFFVNAALRIVLHLRFADWVARSHRSAHAVFLVLLLSGAALWGGLLCASGEWTPLRPANGALQLVVIAVCAAGTMTLALLNSVRIGMPVVLCAPNVLALLADASLDSVLTAALTLLFLAYVVFVSRAVQRDHWVAVQANALLAERAHQLEQLSITDALTQLHNRLHFDRLLKHEWARARRSGDPLTVLIVDLDHFKRLNDNHGHPFGDCCLKEAAAAMRRVIYRPADVLARYGGEEFIALLPATDAAGGLTVAERLLHNVGGLVLTSPRGDGVRVTCSIGIATMRPAPGVDWMALVSEADRALYLAKNEGRNRVVSAGRAEARSA